MISDPDKCFLFFLIIRYFYLIDYWFCLSGFGKTKANLPQRAFFQGPSLCDLLQSLHDFAQAEDVARGRTPLNWKLRWQQELGFAVARSVGQSISESVGAQGWCTGAG